MLKEIDTVKTKDFSFKSHVIAQSKLDAYKAIFIGFIADMREDLNPEEQQELLHYIEQKVQRA